MDKMSLDTQTLLYYDQNADEFVSRTLSLDMSELYEKFLPLLPDQGKIFDAGCGSGRDAKAFKDLGYEVVAADASIELVQRSSILLGQPALHLRLEDILFVNEFDGIWANASLLHLSTASLGTVLEKLAAALKKDGVLFMSFKYGQGEHIRTGRLFNDQNENSIKIILERIPAFSIIEIWKCADSRSKDSPDFWLHCFVRKNG